MNVGLILFIVFTLAFLTALMIFKTDLSYRKDLCLKLGRFYRVLVQWMNLKQNNISIVDYFTERDIRTIAVYGMKELGMLICKELENSEVTVKYCIDKRADYFFSDMDLKKPNDELEPVDMIVVTVLTKNSKLLEGLKEKMNCPVVTIANVVFAFKIKE